MSEKPAFWSLPIRCSGWCKRTFFLFLPYGTAPQNWLCDVCDARISRWIAQQMQHRPQRRERRW